MSFFDLAAGLVLLVSGLVGFIRGGAREAAGIAALAMAAIVGFLALRYTGPIARHAIHTIWLANLAAVLAVFAAVYALLRALAAAIVRALHRSAALGTLDRVAGAGLGLGRACLLLGLVTLTLNAVIPPQRAPSWLTQARLYPLGVASAARLKAFAPKGEALAAQVAPRVSQAIASDDSNSPSPSAGQLKVDVERDR